jgi:quinol monooxygenase YgiN
MLRLNCFFQAKEGRLDDALTAAKELTAASLKQDGCVAYDVFASATRPGILLICETWRDETALAAHSASEPFVKNVALINDCGEMKIEKFEM